jgi:WD40 repeat protein
MRQIRTFPARRVTSSRSCHSRDGDDADMTLGSRGLCRCWISSHAVDEWQRKLFAAMLVLCSPAMEAQNTGGEFGMPEAGALGRFLEAMSSVSPPVPVVGAGFSVAVTGGAAAASRRGLLLDGIEVCERVISPLPPGWADRMRDQLDGPDVISQVAAADEISRQLRAVRGGREFNSWIRQSEELRPTNEGRQAIEAVRGLGPVIATTNYDTLIEGLEPRWSSYTWTDEKYSTARTGKDVVLHLFGVAAKPQSVILTSADYGRVGEDGLNQILDRALFASSTFIFIGYGENLHDLDIAPLMDIASRFLRTVDVEHYLLVRGSQLRQFIEHSPSPVITPVAYGEDFGDLIPFLQKLASREGISVSQDPRYYEQLVTSSREEVDQRSQFSPPGISDRGESHARDAFGADGGAVLSVAFSPDGTLVASGNGDGDVRVRDARTGHQVAHLLSDNEAVWSTAFGPDGTVLAVGDEDGSVRTWDWSTGEEHALAGDIGVVLAVAFDHSGALLAAGAEEGTVRLWLQSAGESIWLADDVGEVVTAAFSPDRSLVAVGWYGGLRLWDVQTGGDRSSFADAGVVQSVAFSPDGSELAIGGEDGSVQFRDLSSGRDRDKVSVNVGSVQSLTFSPDGALLAVGGADGSVRLLDALSGALQTALAGHDGWVSSMAFSPDGATLVTGGGYDGTVRLWDVRTGEQRSYPSVSGVRGGTRDIEQELADATHAVQADPSNARALVARAEILREMGGLEEALVDADQAIAADPLSREAILARAQILRDMGRFNEALAAADKAVNAEPADATARLDRARILRNLGRLDEALAEATRAADLSSDPEAGRLMQVLANELEVARAVPDATRDGQWDSGAGPEVAAAVETSLGGGYDADAAEDSGREDALGFRLDVNMLCSVLADNKISPPISVGLFGEWGSGKSFFMRLMRQRIYTLAEVARNAEATKRETRYCGYVQQITFNAWHYTDANLWASLAAEIFFRLASPDHDPMAEERAYVEHERKAILKRLESYQPLFAELKEARELAAARCEQAREQLSKVESKRQDKNSELWAIADASMGVAKELAKNDELKELRRRAANELEIPEPTLTELPQVVDDLSDLAGRARATWRLLAKHKGTRAWVAGLASAFVALSVTGLILLATQGSKWHGWLAIGVALSTLGTCAAAIRPFMAAVRSGLSLANKALQREEELDKQFREQQDRERARLQDEVDLLTTEQQELAAKLEAAKTAEAKAKTEEQDLRADRRLRRFLEERSASDDYQGQRGLISLLHEDFRRLDVLLREAKRKTGGELPRIDRIVLYIDDLDRCPPTRVVEVLQAIHLLLALPLFVVVVGVDPRWLLRSVQSHYHALLQDQAPVGAAADDLSHWASTPQNYLEKIFQIPFALMPMTSSGFAQLVRDLAGEAETQPAMDAQADTQEESEPRAAAGRAAAMTGSEPAVVTGPGTGFGLAESPSDQPSNPPPGMSADHSASEEVPGSSADEGLAGAVGPLAATEGAEPAGLEDRGKPLSDRMAQHDDLRRQLDGGAEPSAAYASKPPAAPPSVEEQRIPTQEGSVASSAEDQVDPNPVGLRLTDHEIRFIQALAPMVTTPRAGTRLVNIYRMIRSTQATGGSSRFLDLSTGTGDYQAILLLLAIVSGFPNLAAWVFEALLKADSSTDWPAFVDGLQVPSPGLGEAANEVQPDDWTRMREALAAIRDSGHVQIPCELRAYCEWAPRVARFSFATARVLFALSPP